jgi:predicted negative regulator of RcsB-dependent stress response
MKADRRHELEYNDLERWLAQTVERIKPYANLILLGIIAVMVGWIAYKVWSWQAGKRAAQAWERMYAAGYDVSKLAEVVEQFPRTDAAQMATIMLADLYAAEGCDLLFRDKALATMQLRKAADHYLQLLEQTRNPVLKERASYGLARVREATGELEEAIRRYEEVERTWPNGVFAQAAAERAWDLKRRTTRDMYDRFVKYDPRATSATESKPPESPAPKTGD